jgi:2-methylfumaryl-CoA hydratase
VARGLGYPRARLHDWLAFHIVFGKSVGQISLNAVANLGYADGRFLRPVYPGDTLRAESTVLGTREVSSGKAGIVWVATRGLNQHDEVVLRYTRWVMVEKRDSSQATGAADEPTLPKAVPASELAAHAELDASFPAGLAAASGGEAFFEDYAVGERIDHVDGMTIDEADHTAATRLYQNTARVHFNQHQMAGSRFGKRLVYGGHVISIVSALSVNGLENVVGVLALNGGSHQNPTFAGDTIYAWTEILEKAELSPTVGALRVLHHGAKDVNPAREKVDKTDPRVVLELDLWLAMPRRGS